MSERALLLEFELVISASEALLFPGLVESEGTGTLRTILEIVDAAPVVRAVEAPHVAVGVPLVSGPLGLPVGCLHREEDAEAFVNIPPFIPIEISVDNQSGLAFFVGPDGKFILEVVTVAT